MGKHFVLIHGAWHGGWCWEGVISELQRAGHAAEAPTMPGHGPGQDRSKIRFDDYVKAIVSVLQKQAVPSILVGHSSAGSPSIDPIMAPQHSFGNVRSA